MRVCVCKLFVRVFSECFCGGFGPWPLHSQVIYVWGRQPCGRGPCVNVFCRSVSCLLTLSRVLFGAKTRSGLSVLSSVASVSRVAPESPGPTPRCEDRSPSLLLEGGARPSASCLRPRGVQPVHSEVTYFWGLSGVPSLAVQPPQQPSGLWGQRRQGAQEAAAAGAGDSSLSG